jgi:2,5-diamino-6-(ribosylamino)-4(3H)-pyrimidinone 5'-phosphate reductase
MDPVERPFVYVNMAMTADGKVSSVAREAPRFTSPHDRQRMDRLRAESDGVLIGAETIRRDDPPLRLRDPEMQDYRRSLGKPEGLLGIVVTATARLDPGAAFFRQEPGSSRIVATVEERGDEALEPLAAVAEIWRCGRGRVDLVQLLRRLRSRGVGRLLVEGGGELHWQLLRLGLVDEIFVTMAPCLLGGRLAPTLLDGEGFGMEERRRLALLDLGRHGDEIYCRWAVLR